METSRRGFLKLMGLGAASVVTGRSFFGKIKEKSVKLIPKRFRTKIKPLEGRGISGDDVLSGGEEILRF